MDEVIEVRVGKVWLDADGILRLVVVLSNAEVVLEDMKEIAAAYRKLSKGIARPALSDIRNVKSANRATRTYAVGEDVSSVLSAAAMLVSSPVSTVIGNFALRVDKPPYPTQLFRSQVKAIEWLKTFIE